MSSISTGLSDPLGTRSDVVFCLFARDAYRLVDQQLPCSRKVVALAEVSTHPAVRPNCTARPTKIVGTCHTKKKSGIHRMKPRTAPYFRWLLGPAPFPHPCTFSHPTTIHTPTAGILRGPPPPLGSFLNPRRLGVLLFFPLLLLLFSIAIIVSFSFQFPFV